MPFTICRSMKLMVYGNVNQTYSLNSSSHLKKNIVKDFFMPYFSSCKCVISFLSLSIPILGDLRDCLQHVFIWY